MEDRSPSTHEDRPAPAGSREPGQHIRSSLGDLRRLVRSSIAVRGVALALVSLAGIALLSLGLDRAFRLSVPGRVVALLVWGGGWSWIAWRFLLRPLLVPLPDRVLADVLERSHPRLEDAVRSAVDFLRHRARPSAPAATPRLTLAMEDVVIGQAAAGLDSVEHDRVVDTPRLVNTLLRCLLALSLFLVVAIVYREAFTLWFRRNVLLADTPWPYRTTLEVEGFESGWRGVPRGNPIEIHVRAGGEIPVRMKIRIRYQGDSARYNLAREGQEPLFAYRHPSVTEPFEFTVEGGDNRTGPYSVRVLERPRVEEIAVVLTPPEYTGRDPIRAEGELGELASPAGSTLSLQGRANKPLAGAWLETEGRRVPLKVAGDGTRFSGGYRPEKGGSIAVHLLDREEVPPDQILRFSLHLQDDRRPEVQARVVGLGPMIAPGARMPLAIGARDDYRVVTLALAWKVTDREGGASEGSAPLEPPAEATDRVTADRVWEVGTLRLESEKRLDVRVLATDNDAISGAKSGASTTLGFLVVSDERLGEEFLRREAEQRRVLLALSEEEKSVRDSVYKLLGEEWKREGSLVSSVVETMLSLARLERQHSRQVGAVASAVDQILTEMENNRIGEADDLRRLGRDIIDPLRDLATSRMPEAAVRLGRVRDAKGPEGRMEEGLELATRIEEQIEILDRVIASMARLEGFTEIVKQLRVIIKTQAESKDAAQETLRRQIESLLEEGGDGIFESDEPGARGERGGGAPPPEGD